MKLKPDVNDEQQRKFVYNSNDEMSESRSKLHYGNFFVLGGIWIELMKKVMVGKRSCVVPKIYNNKNIIPTAKHEEIMHGTPETYEAYYSDKAGKKKNIDMPLDLKDDYSRMISHHQTHKESDAKRSSGNNYKWYYTGNKDNTLHKYLYPHVKNTRTAMQEKWKWRNNYISDTLYISKSMTIKSMKNSVSKIKEYIADPDNYVKEKLCVSLSVATGTIIGSRTGCSRAILNGGLGAMASGMFCSQKWTEEFFRNLLLRMVPDDKRNS